MFKEAKGYKLELDELKDALFGLTGRVWCGRRVGVQYLGAGEYFGCRHCYNLTYTSSKESGKYDDMYRQWGFDSKEAKRAFKV